MNRPKTYYLVSLAIITLTIACSEKKKEPDTKQYILSKHDQLMQKGEQAMTIKMQFDTLNLSHFTYGVMVIDTVRSNAEEIFTAQGR